ncbi:MAG TPA: hypothetical protein VGO06_23910 [Bosea sp. (in: a-proteobacteria)]|jgi:hypothetical protein|uniref:hypothetical protein n=1 Tax=Bosea sp. (in: a-proteobacteria) TaxID=1871050 RepID=UPI002E0F13DB|nr:hypothetical protein [Bosea sp. (in: a-proteobacteria)]
MSHAAENLFPLYAQPGPADGLTPAEARDVLLILGEVAERLARSSNSAAGIRRRLDAIAGAIVGFLDQIDGDSDFEESGDLETVCEDEGAQCDDEGVPDDNGLADLDGMSEQGFDGLPEWLHLIQVADRAACLREERRR